MSLCWRPVLKLGAVFRKIKLGCSHAFGKTQPGTQAETSAEKHVTDAKHRN